MNKNTAKTTDPIWDSRNSDEPQEMQASPRTWTAEQLQPLVEACQTFSEWLRLEEEGMPKTINRDTPNGEAQWRQWFYGNMELCDRAQRQARDALAVARSIGLLALFYLCASLTANAQLIISFSGGNDLSVGPGTAGYGFTTTAPQTVKTLGVYDWDATTPGLYSSHMVGLWDATTHALLASATVPATGATAIGSFWYVPITPLTLPAGHSFVLGASYSDSDFDFAKGNITSVTTAPGITMGNAMLSSGSLFGFPDLDVSGANLGFIGPNLGFTPIPEPSTITLVVGLALVGFVFFRSIRGHVA